MGRQLRILGDTLETQYLRPLHVGVQDHERIQIGGNLIDVARIVALRCAREFLGLNN